MKNLLLSLMLCLALFSCEKGCTDPDALNHSYTAEKEDGSCKYTRVVFYGRYSHYWGVPIQSVSISVNGAQIGSLSGYYPSGPGNCSAPGTVNYQFEDGGSVDWGAQITLMDGRSFYSNGVMSPSSSLECMAVNVTP